MNRRSFFRLGVGAGLAPVADKVFRFLPLAAPVQKMDALPTRHYRQYLLNEDDVVHEKSTAITIYRVIPGIGLYAIGTYNSPDTSGGVWVDTLSENIQNTG